MTFAAPFCLVLLASLLLLSGCGTAKKTADQPVVSFFHVDPKTAGSISGVIRYTGPKPRLVTVDMSEDPACMEAHRARAFDESLVAGPGGALANVFVYVKSGLEGKTFETSETPVTIDQKGCWFHPRVIGIEAGQPLRVVNSDPVTHNIHPLAAVNRDWNHSQGPGDPPLARKFPKPEVMIPVKCNIHSWMHAFIGVRSDPYFAVSGSDGSFQIRNLPPGNYVIEAWHEKLGTQEQQVAVAASSDVQSNFRFARK